MKAFLALALIPLVAATQGSYSTFSGYGHSYSHGLDTHSESAYHKAPTHSYGYKPAPAYKPQPAPYKPAPVYHKPAPAYHKPTPAYHQPSYGYAPKPHYGYEQPKHNCTVETVRESAEVCTPQFEQSCANVDIAVKRIVDTEFCYTVTRTVCTESIEEIENEICTYSYQRKEEDTTAQTVEVAFERQTNVQMVTVCQPTYGGYGYQSYGHQYCKEVAQETQYNVPVVSPVDVPVTVAYPEPVKTCVNKPISLPRVSCEDLSEEKCITVPEVEEGTESVEKCEVSIGEPKCETVYLDLPKQRCVELVYGYAQDTHKVEPAYKAAEE